MISTFAKLPPNMNFFSQDIFGKSFLNNSTFSYDQDTEIYKNSPYFRGCSFNSVGEYILLS